MPPPSPYSQRLPHSDYGLIVSSRRRPMSATLPMRPPSGARKPKVDSKFIADPALWDPATPRSEKSATTIGSGKPRPFSAPVKKKGYVLYGVKDFILLPRVNFLSGVLLLRIGWSFTFHNNLENLYHSYINALAVAWKSMLQCTHAFTCLVTVITVVL